MKMSCLNFRLSMIQMAKPLKHQLKTASENAFCLCYLLHIFANIIDYCNVSIQTNRADQDQTAPISEGAV